MSIPSLGRRACPLPRRRKARGETHYVNHHTSFVDSPVTAESLCLDGGLTAWTGVGHKMGLRAPMWERRDADREIVVLIDTKSRSIR